LGSTQIQSSAKLVRQLEMHALRVPKCSEIGLKQQQQQLQVMRMNCLSVVLHVSLPSRKKRRKQLKKQLNKTKNKMYAHGTCSWATFASNAWTHKTN
jgi:hypothetical protein